MNKTQRFFCAAGAVATILSTSVSAQEAPFASSMSLTCIRTKDHAPSGAPISACSVTGMNNTTGGMISQFSWTGVNVTFTDTASQTSYVYCNGLQKGNPQVTATQDGGGSATVGIICPTL
ncbi:MAG: hypothetical protein V4807_03870 [Burkholderia gladioli]